MPFVRTQQDIQVGEPCHESAERAPAEKHQHCLTGGQKLSPGVDEVRR